MGVGVRVTGGVALLERETEGVFEADAPADRLGVGESVRVVLSLWVLLGVIEEVPVEELVGEPVGVGVGETDAVFVELNDSEPELETDAPGEREAVGVSVSVELPLRVDEAVKDPVPVPLKVAV